MTYLDGGAATALPPAHPRRVMGRPARGPIVVSNALETRRSRLTSSRGGKALMIEAGRGATEAAGDAVDAAFAIVAVSMALGRLIAVRGRQESRRVLARLGVPGELTAAAGQPVPAARRLLSRRLGPVVRALLPRSVPARLDERALMEEQEES